MSKTTTQARKSTRNARALEAATAADQTKLADALSADRVVSKIEAAVAASQGVSGAFMAALQEGASVTTRPMAEFVATIEDVLGKRLDKVGQKAAGVYLSQAKTLAKAMDLGFTIGTRVVKDQINAAEAHCWMIGPGIASLKGEYDAARAWLVVGGHSEKNKRAARTADEKAETKGTDVAIAAEMSNDPLVLARQMKAVLKLAATKLAGAASPEAIALQLGLREMERQLQVHFITKWTDK